MLKLRTTWTTKEIYNEETGDYKEVPVAPEGIITLLEEKLSIARKYIDEASAIAKIYDIDFKPLGDLFSNDEIDSQGWSSSHC